MVHILLLIQYSNNPKSKVWADFDCVHDCCKYICKTFEDNLKKLNPTLPEITYDIEDLYDYVDNVLDMSCLISRDNDDVYIGYDKGWIKMKLFFVLRREVEVIEEFVN